MIFPSAVGALGMRTFLRFIGAGWAIIGVVNAVLVYWTSGTADPFFNVGVFIVPGAIVYGIGRFYVPQ